MEHKAFGVAELKATGPASSGQFEAIVSAFGNVDSGGDRMLKGAFVETLKSPADGGRGFPPVVWTHLWGVAPIGATAAAEEVEGFKTAKGDTVDGLYIKGDLFVDENQTAKEVYTAMSRKGGDGLPVLRDFSFGYSALDFDFVEEDGAKIRNLARVELYEVGPTLVGMNDAASLVDVKSLNRNGLEHLLASLKAGARNSAKDAEMLQEIHDLTGELGVDCAGKSARPAAAKTIGAAIATKALELKGYDDIDSYDIYLLGGMIDYGASYILRQSDPADVEGMRALMLTLVDMLATEIAEGDEGAGTGDVTMAGLRAYAEKLLPTSGKTADPPAGSIEPTRVAELLTAFPAASI